MSLGSFVFVLHSHLPFYRKSGMWPFGEENLYECMYDTYIPLLNAINELKDEGIKAKLTIGITPILAEQLADEHLINGFITYIDGRIKAAEEDLERYPSKYVAHSQHLEYLANFYLKFFKAIKEDFIYKYNKNVIEAFKQLQDAGCIEIITSAATHCFSPLLATDSTLNAQFRTGVTAYKKLFGRDPKGAWLPECAYRTSYDVVDPVTGETVRRPSVEEILANNDLKYFFTDYHPIEGGTSVGTRRVVGIYGNIEYIPLPERPLTGLTTSQAYWLKDAEVAVMGRNNRASFQVWSAADGYPGDGCYREFHRKDSNSGMHYWRITSKEVDLGDKMLYDPVLAMARVNENSDHYVGLIGSLVKDLTDKGLVNPLVLVSFDTELYGHWWFEGIEWLKQVIRKMHNHLDFVTPLTASEYLESNEPKVAISLPESSWGQGGHYWVWQNHQTEWMWPIIHGCERKMEYFANTYSEQDISPQLARALNQLARELLLLESSDWPFLVTTFQAKDYATERFRDHVARFERIASLIETGQIDESDLAAIEDIDNPFTELDFRSFKKGLIKYGKVNV